MKRVLGILILLLTLSISIQAQVTKESLNLTVNPITQITGKLGESLQDTDLFTEALIDTFTQYGNKQEMLADLFTNNRISIITQASGNTVILAVVFNSFDLNLLQKNANPNNLDFIDVRLPGYLKLAVDAYATKLKLESGVRGVTFNSGFSFERDGSICQFNMSRSFDSWTISSFTMITGGNQFQITGRPYNQYDYINPMQNPNTGQMNPSALLYAFFAKASTQYTAANYF